MRYLTSQAITLDHLTLPESRAIPGAAGALVTFIGIVRADRIKSRTVRALSYEACVDMAEQEIARLVDVAQARWPLEGIEIRHRVGLVELGQMSVLIVVAAAHREAAYAASQFLITQIKRQVPIWKREHYDDGTSQWAAGSQEAASPSGYEELVHAHSTSLRAMVSEQSESNHAHV